MKRMPKDLLKWTAAGFALVATATAEYELARAIGMNEWIAAAVPGALDAYVVRALRSGREVLTSVVAMVGVNAASHLVTAGILPVEWPLITAVSAIAPLVLWRVHALGTPGEARRRVLWGLPRRARKAEHTSTEPEHTGHTSTEPVQAHERAHELATWGDDLMDVHDAVHTGAEPSTPSVPVHAPYQDHVPARRLSLVKEFDPVHSAVHAPDPVDWVDPDAEHAPDPVCPACKHGVHAALACDSAFCDCLRENEHTSTDASTRTADDWNLEHVSTGTLTPYDTAHMERARELFHTLGRVPSFRALKHGGTPGMGTDRAKRIRAALKIEAEGKQS